GSGGTYDRPTSQQMTDNVTQIAATGDPDLLREFIQGVMVKVGATGQGETDWALTDLYRRSLVNLLPENHPIRLEAQSNPTALFGADPRGMTPTGAVQDILASRVGQETRPSAETLLRELDYLRMAGHPSTSPVPTMLFRNE